MELNRCKKKIKEIFDRFYNEDYHIDIFYLKAIYNCFENSPEKSIEKQLLDTAFFSDLVLCSTINVEKIKCTETQVFVVDLLTLLVKNELQYCKLVNSYGFDTIRAKLLQLREKIQSPNLLLAFTKFATAQINHSSGVITLVDIKAWVCLLKEDTHSGSLSVARGTYDFIAKLVWKLNEYEEEKIIIEVFQYILKPILCSEYHTETISLDNENRMSEMMLSNLYALYTIFDDADNFFKTSIVLDLADRYFVLRYHLHAMFTVTRNEEILCLISKTMFRICFAIFSTGRNENNLLNELVLVYNNEIQNIIGKCKVNVLINHLVSCLKFWSKINQKVGTNTFIVNGQQFDISIQFVVILIVPILSYASQHNKEKSFETFFLKLNSLAMEHIIKSYYIARTFIESNNVKQSCIQALKELLTLKGNLNNTQAGIIFQALYYALDSHVLSDGSGSLILTESLLVTPDDFKILSLTLDMMLMLLKEHHINWYESVEIICFQSSLMNILKQNMLPSKLLLQVLNLIDWSIKNFLSPDMTLLVESKQGSTLNEIGIIIKSFLEHKEWEIRDSALEVLLSCIEVSFIKYVPLQKLITENNLVVDAATIALNDEEMYVQTTALKCLAASAKIETIWSEVVIVHPNIYTQLANLMKNNQEGMIRKESTNVLVELYINQRIHKSFVLHLNKLMAWAALKDLHWEVQLSALNFWKHNIQKLFADRSVVHGKFPSVTFCKVKRKIITFNDNLIKEHLNSIMNQLSLTGCLSVLDECLKDSNIKVMENAYYIVSDLCKILDCYKLESVVVTRQIEQNEKQENNDGDLKNNGDERNMEGTENVFLHSNTDKREEVIDCIVATSTRDLIESSLSRNFNVKSEDMEDVSYFSNWHIKYIEPNDFIKTFKSTNFLSTLKNKEFYNLCNLDSILNEILTFDVNKTVTVDCCC